MSEEGPYVGDETPAMTGRSLMVGNSPHRQQGVTFVVHENGSEHESERGHPSYPGRMSQISLNQSQSSALLARSRSDEEALAQCVADAGLNAFGCVFVEVWAMSEDGLKLTRPSGGHWMDPAFAQSLPNEELIDIAWGLDLEAADCPPGAGLAGTMADEGGLGNRDIHWRQIKSLIDDPFIQRESGDRMKRLFQVGIGLVAAVPFQFNDQRGIVLFFSRSTVNVDLLRAPSNEQFMLGSTDLIGANYALRKARKESAEMRKTLFREAIKKVKKELGLGKSLGSLVLDTGAVAKLKELREMAQDEPPEPELPRPSKLVWKLVKKTYKFGKKCLKRVKNSQRKWRGAKLHGPPRQSFSDCFTSFMGAFLTMLTLLKIANSIRVDGRFDFDPGWYSSTLCIVYALTPAPVGQPRQIFLAHLWNMIVGLLCRQIPTGGYVDEENEYKIFEHFMEWTGAPPDATYGMPLIWVQALAVALGISGQAYIGILHPPATGLAMTFVSKATRWTWTTMISVMMADGVVTVMAMLLINLSEKKQWPLYWIGLGWEGSGGTVGYLRSKTRGLRTSMKVKGEEAV